MGEGLWQGLAQLVMCLCKPVAGIEPTGNMVKQPAKFTVDTISAGQGDLMVFVEDPEGNKEEVCWRMLRPLSASHGACHRARERGAGSGTLLFPVVSAALIPSTLPQADAAPKQRCPPAELM